MYKIKIWYRIFLWIGWLLLPVLLLNIVIMHFVEIPISWQVLYIPAINNAKNILLVVVPISFMNGYALKSVYMEIFRLSKKSSD